MFERMEQRTLATRPPHERAEAWLLTGPIGRAWAFVRDMSAAVPMLARYWVGRLRGRRGDG